MAPRWLRVRVDLVAGRGRPLSPAPGRVMLVPPTATFADFGLGVDLALGRWDVTRQRSFRATPAGRHEVSRPAQPSGDLAPERLLRDAVRRGDQFEYLFDDDEKWLHECVVEGSVAGQDRAPIPVPILGWGMVPDQYGRTEPPDVAEPAPKPRASRRAAKLSEPAPSTSRRQRRRPPVALDLSEVRAAAREGGMPALLEAVDGRELASVLQQVGDALARLYRAAPRGEQAQARAVMSQVRGLLIERQWDGDDVLAAEIESLLTGSERRGRTLHVDLEELADVMSSGGADPGGYLHLDTGEVVHAFLHHGIDDLSGSLDASPAGGPGANRTDAVEDADGGDNLWIYIDHAGDAEWEDMRAFADATSAQLGGILSVAIRGKGAFTRFRRTVEELDLWDDWRVFSDDRAWGRARALLRSQGIRPV